MLYQPLNSAQGEIRVIDLRPAGKISAPIVGSLRLVCLNEQPQYEALSYVWGLEEGGTDIDLNGSPFRVFENCEAALRALRHRSSVRTVWIDAICINQQDLVEQAAQVQLMRDVYQKASRVCVWLGEHSNSSIVGMRSLQGKLSMGWHQWKVDRKFGRPTLSFRESLGSSVSLQNRAHLVEAHELGEIREILERPWFRRTWIIQEAVLAKELIIMCGTDTLEWDGIAKFIKRARYWKGIPRAFGMDVNKADGFPDETYQIICRFREKWASGGWDVNLLQLLYDYRHLNCRKPQDRIYGFLGLAPSASDLGIVPNYLLKASEVYKSFVRHMIDRTGMLDVLNCRREWRPQGFEMPERRAVAHSVIDQSRYHDVQALVTDGANQKPRRGWARLPPGWERVPAGSRQFQFLNHNDGTTHERSPLEGRPPVEAQHFTSQRTLPPGWIKKWNNLGQVCVCFSPHELSQQTKLAKSLKESGLDALPSWVPNWAAKTEYDPEPFLDWADPEPQYWACGPHAVARSIQYGYDDMMGLEGVIFDVIKTICVPWHPASDIGPFSRKGIHEIEQWEAVALDASQIASCPYADKGGRAGALWRTLAGDRAGKRAAPETDGLYVETWYDREGWLPLEPDAASKGIWDTAVDGNYAGEIDTRMHAHLIELIAKTTEYEERIANSSFFQILKSTFTDVRVQSATYGQYIRRIRRTCAHRALFVTRRGYMGLAPWNAQADDVVCVLKGGKTPYILRVPPAGSAYQLVGETYVQGIMGGEAILPDDHENEWRLFNLR